MATIKPELLSALGISPREGEYLSALTEAEQEQLITTIERTERKHHDEIMQALENMLDNVPRLLRGSLRKMFK